jgi:integrase
VATFEKWDGGRVKVDRLGRKTWRIERMVGGERFHIPLEVDSEPGALAELALFERDPAAYRTKAEAREAEAEEAARVDAETVAGFLKHLAAETDPSRRPRSERYRKNVKSYLAWWGDQFAGRDLREVKLRDLHAALDSAPTGRKQRIIALKSFCSWLREKGRLDRAHDATMDLKVPKPERKKRLKGYSMRHLELLYPHIDDVAVRAVVMVRALTGMHHTEIARVAKGDGDVVPLKGQGQIAGAIYFDHKKKAPHLLAVDLRTLAAAQFLQRRGSAPAESWIYKQIREAAERATTAEGREVEPILPNELRHCYAQWSDLGDTIYPRRRGAPLELVSANLGHESLDTTQIYRSRSLRLRALVVFPVKLEHPGDPVPVLDGEVPNALADLLGA